MVGAFGRNAHFKQIKADFTAHILPLIVGSDIHITRLVKCLPCRITVIIKLKKIKLKLRAEKAGNTEFFSGFHRIL